MIPDRGQSTISFKKVYADIERWAEAWSIAITDVAFPRSKVGEFDGTSARMNQSYDYEERTYYLIYALGSIVCWCEDQPAVQAMFDELRVAKERKREDAARLDRAITNYRYFETRSSAYGSWLLDHLNWPHLIPSYSNFMRADLESMTVFHRQGRAPVWQTFFARWNEEVASALGKLFRSCYNLFRIFWSDKSKPRRFCSSNNVISFNLVSFFPSLIRHYRAPWQRKADRQLTNTKDGLAHSIRVRNCPMNESLKTYISDHLAGAGFAVTLLADLSHQDVVPGAALLAQRLLPEIEADRITLQEFSEQIDAAPGTVKEVTAWLTEKFSRLKLSLVHPFGIFEAIEALTLGVLGKLALWSALETARHDSLDLLTLSARAREQHRQLDALRMELALTLFRE